MKYRRIISGIVATPLPMVLGMLLLMSVFSERPDTPLILFTIVSVSAAIWVLILISKTIIHFTPWRGRRAHMTIMFVVTMIPLLIWDPVELEPDASFSYQVNDQGVQTFDFAVGGIIAMALISFMSAVCMWIFWRFFARDLNETDRIP